MSEPIQALPYEHIAALESELMRGDVIDLMMPSDAYAFLLRDDQGKFCFVWEECHHGQDTQQTCFPFETVEQGLLWIFSCIFSRSMTRQEAEQHYCRSYMTSQVGSVLSSSLHHDEGRGIDR